ncbi:MAG TPA: GTP-binding protein, partial [Pseudoflavonifractor sp.]|nr:GTP-binding protein [Pseudoflavonifractor sp.]
MADFVLGVAGHVDHGKTALTYALTGVETDRLAEEKRRGLTIETGFAPLPLPGGGVAALVDVPGHEAFLRNMLSGAAGLDAVLLTVAADDGVMPQTREHLDICALLGVTRGLVAITKSDLADEARLTQVRGEIASLTAGSFLEGAPVLSVSARTGAGLEALYSALAELADASRPVRARQEPFRLNIDRVFTREGFGTIVTGTVRA